MPPQTKQEITPGTRPFKGLILNHKQRYHYDGNFNFDSANVSQCMGKTWVSSAPISVKKGLNLIQEDEIDETQQMDQTQKISQLISSKPDAGIEQPKDKLGQTQYSRQNLVAQKVLEMARKKQIREKQRYQEEMNQQRQKQHSKSAFYKTDSSQFDLTANYEHPNRTHSKRGEPLAKFNSNGRPTTNFIKGHTNWKITYPDLEEKDEQQERTLQEEFLMQTQGNQKQTKFHPQQRKNRSMFNKTSENFAGFQKKQINPFRMTTYDTTYGTPFRKYHYDEEEQDDNEYQNYLKMRKSQQEDFVSTNYNRNFAKTAQNSQNFSGNNYLKKKMDKVDQDQQKLKGLISYKGVIPKNMNMAFKWNHHSYERQNFMRKAPIWSGKDNDNGAPGAPKDFRKKGYISTDKWRKTIRTKDYI